MQVRVVLLAALGVPLTACFDTRTYLGEELLGALSKDLANSGQRLRAILDANPNLHSDEEQKQWDVNDLELFETYFSALKEFVALAVQEPTFMHEMKDLDETYDDPPPSQSLVQTFAHLLSTGLAGDEIFKVVPAPTVAAFRVMLAKADYMTLGAAYERFRFNHGEASRKHSLSEWRTATGMFGPVVEATCTVWSLSSFMEGVGLEDLAPKEIGEAEGMGSDTASLSFLTQKLEEATRGLPEAFLSLQLAAEELMGVECNVWDTTFNRILEDTLKVEPKDILQIWGQQQDAELLQNATLQTLLKALDRFRAKLVIEMTLLGSTTVGGFYVTPVSFDEAKLDATIQAWLPKMQTRLALLWLDVRWIRAMHQEDQRASALVENIYACGLCGRLGEHRFFDEISQVRHALYWNLPRQVKGPQLGLNTVQTLREAHRLAKCMFEAYAVLFDLMRQTLDRHEFDKLLLQFLGDWHSRQVFGMALYTMKRIEGVEGVMDQKLYEKFAALLRGVPLPADGKSAMSIIRDDQK